jgi:hypothetical protein
MVFCVLLVIHRAQVIWVYAQGSVADVVELNTRWDLLNKKRVGDSVSVQVRFTSGGLEYPIAATLVWCSEP